MESVPQAILSQIAKDFFTDQLSQKKSWQEPDNQITGVIQSLYLALTLSLRYICLKRSRFRTSRPPTVEGQSSRTLEEIKSAPNARLSVS